MSNNTNEAVTTSEQVVSVIKSPTGEQQTLATSHAQEVKSAPPNKPQKKRKWRPYVVWSGVLACVTVGGYFAYHEMIYSDFQAKLFSQAASKMTFRVQDGPAPKDNIIFPKYGPFDLRMGYVSIPSYVTVLQQNNFVVRSQAHWSDDLRGIEKWGVYPPYQEKTRAGLVIKDQRGDVIYDARYPKHIFNQFTDIAPLTVSSLLFIENKELLNTEYPHRNPSLEWVRMMRVSLDLVLNTLQIQDENLAGGSTLATQIEKYRHSPNGLTMTPLDKLQQIGSASLRAYRKGENTIWSRSQIALDYINTVPLAARAGYGEVNGIGDGLWVWYERDPEQVNALLKRKDNLTPAEQKDLALSYKQVLSLFLAQRRPSYYLASKSPDALNKLTNVYLDLMAQDGLIHPNLAQLAKSIPLKFGSDFSKRPEQIYAGQKAVNYTRARLTSMLGVPSLYELDRLDLSINTTFDQDLQKKATAVLKSMRTPEGAKQAGLYGGFLLDPSNDPSKIIVSFTLMERTPNANVVRIQADNYDQPFDINEGVKLDLGSTAKLRTMISYLNIMADIHDKYSKSPIEKLNEIQTAPSNRLLRWGVDYLRMNPGVSMMDMLNAAMDRFYSANPKDSFYTGGGLHTFKNFNSKFDGQSVNVRTALRHSINLPFIRMMQDVASYYANEVTGSTAEILGDINDERRGNYLAKFADKEGSKFIHGFYRKYKGLKPEEIQQKFFDRIHATPTKLSVVYQYVALNPSIEAFKKLLDKELPSNQMSTGDLSAVYAKYGPNTFSLVDLAYIARVHPLEMWTVAYLMRHPEAKSDELLKQSAAERQSVYSWLHKTRNKNAQDLRIRQLLEVEAFLEIHKEWQSLGYPFDSLVPSYATAIGSSADRPAALAELMGILANDGIRLPTVRMQKLEFAKGTPYETTLERNNKVVKQRVLRAEVAQVAKAALKNVVDEGTAQRLGQPFTDAQGAPMYIGGKTGTGDHRYEVFGSGGRLISSVVMNRTATFMFYIGDRYFGTITAFVPGKEAEKYRFTSGLPVQLLKAFVPTLDPYMKKVNSKVVVPPLTQPPSDATTIAAPVGSQPTVPANTATANAAGGFSLTPKADAAKTDVPKADAAKTETHKVETTKVETTKVETTKVETTKVETTKVEAPKVTPPKADVPKPTDAQVKKVDAPVKNTVADETAKPVVTKPAPVNTPPTPVEVKKPEVAVKTETVEVKPESEAVKNNQNATTPEPTPAQ